MILAAIRSCPARARRDGPRRRSRAIGARRRPWPRRPHGPCRLSSVRAPSGSFGFPDKVKRKAGRGNARRRARDPERVGAGAVEDRDRHRAFDVNAVGQAEQARGAQVSARRDRPSADVELFDPVRARPRRRRSRRRDRHARRAGRAGRRRRAAPRSRGGARRHRESAHAARRARRTARRRACRGRRAAAASSRWRKRRRQPGGGAAGADRDQHRIAVDDRGQGEIAQIGPVDDVDQHAARASAARRPASSPFATTASAASGASSPTTIAPARSSRRAFGVGRRAARRSG